MKIVIENPDGYAITDEEVEAYTKYIKDKYPNANATVTVGADYADIDYNLPKVPFTRVRRVTGYLTGEVGRWNDAKQAELADRVKHEV